MNQKLLESLYGFFLQSFQESASELSEKFPPALSSELLSLLGRYYDLLGTWNSKIDLISPASEQMILSRHFLDSLVCSLFLQRVYPAELQAGVIDVGSGAGFPGVVIACTNRETPTILVEPREKRAFFLEDVKRILKLSNISVIQSRIESVSRETISQCCPGGAGVSVTRATGMEAAFLQSSKRLLRQDGVAVSLAGPSSDTTVSGASTFPYSLPPDSASRKLVVWDMAISR